MTESKHVALFVTCLVDMMRPPVGFATLKLLEDAGCRVTVPEAQTCCGQPAYNSGDRRDARKVAEQVVRVFQGYDYVVAPSGSCAGMISHHYPDLFRDDAELGPMARDLAAKTFELTAFLHDVLKVAPPKGRLDGKVAYHDSCSSLRECGVKDQPRVLMSNLDGMELRPLESTSEACCGFGGTFCVKYGAVSTAMADKKCDDIEATGADYLLAGDMGCLMNLSGRLSRRGSKIEVRHVAEVLAGDLDADPICGDPDRKAGA